MQRNDPAPLHRRLASQHPRVVQGRLQTGRLRVLLQEEHGVRDVVALLKTWDVVLNYFLYFLPCSFSLVKCAYINLPQG